MANPAPCELTLRLDEIYTYLIPEIRILLYATKTPPDMSVIIKKVGVMSDRRMVIHDSQLIYRTRPKMSRLINNELVLQVSDYKHMAGAGNAEMISRILRSDNGTLGGFITLGPVLSSLTVTSITTS